MTYAVNVFWRFFTQVSQTAGFFGKSATKNKTFFVEKMRKGTRLGAFVLYFLNR